VTAGTLDDLQSIEPVTSIAALQALAPPKRKTVVYVEGYYTPGDGGGGAFYITDNDPGYVNNGTSFALGDKWAVRILQGYITPAMFGVRGDDSDETTRMQEALNFSAFSSSKFVVSKPAVRYRTGSVFVPSNCVIEFEPNVVWRAVDNLGVNDRLLCVHDVNNVVIYGNNSTLDMNKAAYPSGEQRHCLDIRGSTNVAVYNLNTNDSGGDGFYIGRSLTGGLAYSKNITIIGVNSNNNRRQGASVTSAENLLISSCRLSSTSGTNPQSGLDFEPNQASDVLRNILVMNCEFLNNSGTGTEVMLKDITSASSPVSITYMDCRAQGNTFGFQVKYIQSGSLGKVSFIRCQTYENKLAGFHDLANSSSGIVRDYISCESINDNSNNGSLAFYSSYLLEALASELRGTIGSANYRWCKAIDTRGSTNMRRGFASRENGTADVVTNLIYEDCTVQGYDVSLGSEFEHASSITNLSVINSNQIVRAVSGSSAASTRYAGQIYTNAGSGSTATNLTLPSAARTGVEFTFVYGLNASNNFTIRAAAADRIVPLSSADGGAIRATSRGARVVMRAVGDNTWQVISSVGSWTDVP